VRVARNVPTKARPLITVVHTITEPASASRRLVVAFRGRSGAVECALSWASRPVRGAVADEGTLAVALRALFDPFSEPTHRASNDPRSFPMAS
jgi:hypothetical protein